MNDTPDFNDHLLLWLNTNMWPGEKEPYFNPNSKIGLHCLRHLTESGGEKLAELMIFSAGLAPGLFRVADFRLGLSRGGKPLTTPGEKKPDKPKLELSMCFEFWNQRPPVRFRLGIDGPSAEIHSYEVPLVGRSGTKASDGKNIVERSIDLIALSSESLPIVIEAKFTDEVNATIGPSKEASSDLFSHFMQGLSYAVTLRYTWLESRPFRDAWAATLPSDRKPPHTLTDIPVILAANPHYWNQNFHWGPDREHWKDLCTLVKVAQTAGYPIYLGVIRKAYPQWTFQVVAWDSLPTPTTNGPIQFPTEPTS